MIQEAEEIIIVNTYLIRKYNIEFNLNINFYALLMAINAQ